MMPVVHRSFPQPSLSAGELAPSLHGRVDLAIYQTGLKTCLNYIPQAFGGVRNRQGSRFVAGCKTNTSYSRLVPFSFNADQNYILELSGGTVPNTTILSNGSDGTARVFSRGKQQVYSATFTDKAGVAHTKDDPIEIPIPWYMLDLRDLKFSQSGDVLTVTHPHYQPCQIVRNGQDDWAIRKLPYNLGPFQDLNFDVGAKVAASTPTGDSVLNATAPIFTDDTVGQLFYLKQSTFGTPWEPGKVVTTNWIRRSDGKYYRAKTSGKTGSLRPTNESGEWWDGGPDGDTEGGVLWEFLHPGYGVGTIISVGSDFKTARVRVADRSRFPDGVCGADVTAGTQAYTITAVAASDATDPSGTYTFIRATVPSHGRNVADGWFRARVTLKFNTLGNNISTLSYENVNCIPVDSNTIDIDTPWDALAQNLYWSLISAGSSLSPITTPGGSTTDVPAATNLWAFGAWGGAQGWPSCSGFFQQRQCFAATTAKPQGVWTSRTGDYTDFGTSNPIADDDALSFTIASAQIDGIESMLPLDKLVLFTLGGNWVVLGGQNAVLTPGNLSTKLQNYFGSSRLPPLGIGNTALYYGKSGTVRDMSYDFASDTYTGNDLTVRANHLFQDTSILEWDFQQAPFPIVWMVRDDGVLLSMTYLREERVIGWARHTLSGTVESVAVINECGEDHVYLVVKRTIGGSTKRYIECLYGWVGDNYEACFVDSALSYDGRNTKAGQTITATGTYTAGGSVTLTAASCTPFVTGAPSTDIGDQVVLQDAAGALHRATITAVASTTSATGTLDTALPADLQATATDSWAIARDSFSGLSHLEGQIVSIYTDGQTYSGTVSSGSVSLSGHPGFVVTVGLPIVADLEPLPIMVPGQDGPLRENAKLVSVVRIQVENSRSCYLGPDSSNLVKAELRPETDLWTPTTTLGSGMFEAVVAATWNRNGQFFLRHTEATPLSILALYPFAGLGAS